MFRVNVSTASPGGWVDTGNCTDDSPWIDGLNPATMAGINEGDYVTVSAHFPSTTERYRVLTKTADSIRLYLNAVSTGAATVTSVSKMYSDGVAGKVPRTTLAAGHLNAIQEELMNILQLTGASESTTDNYQLYNALLTKFLAKGGGTMSGDLNMGSNDVLSTGNLNGAAANLSTLLKLAGIEYGSGVSLERRSCAFEIASLAASTAIQIANLHFINTSPDRFIRLTLDLKYTADSAKYASSVSCFIQLPHNPSTNNYSYIKVQNTEQGYPGTAPVGIIGLAGDILTTSPADYDDTEVKNSLFYLDASGGLYLRNIWTGAAFTDIKGLVTASYGDGWLV